MIGVGAVPTVINAEFAHLIRSEGYSRQAGFVVALGGIVLAMLYFVLFLLHIRKKSIDIIFMLLLNKTMGISKIAWATPFADWIAFIISMILVIPYLFCMNVKKLYS